MRPRLRALLSAPTRARARDLQSRTGVAIPGGFYTRVTLLGPHVATVMQELLRRFAAAGVDLSQVNPPRVRDAAAPPSPRTPPAGPAAEPAAEPAARQAGARNRARDVGAGPGEMRELRAKSER